MKFIFCRVAASFNHWFQLDRARKDLGYQPLISLEQGFQRLRVSLAGAAEI